MCSQYGSTCSLFMNSHFLLKDRSEEELIHPVNQIQLSAVCVAPFSLLCFMYVAEQN